LIFLLAAYRSFAVGDALAGTLYRRRALWTGGVALVVGWYALQQAFLEYLLPAPTTFVPSLYQYLYYFVLVLVGSIVIFAWIDSTIRVALDLDFLHRDALRWKGLRKYVWALIIVGSVGGGLATSNLQFIIFGILYAILFAYFAGVLIRSGQRVHQTTMKAYSRWLGLILLSLIFEIGTGTAIGFNVNFPLILAAYCMYRAATSLSKSRRMAAASPEGVSMGKQAQGASAPI
jgi:hypothetical protein